MASQVAERKEGQVVIRCEPTLLSRINRLAETQYTGNRSFMARLALTEFVDRKERELAERDAFAVEQAA